MHTLLCTETKMFPAWTKSEREGCDQTNLCKPFTDHLQLISYKLTQGHSLAPTVLVTISLFTIAGGEGRWNALLPSFHAQHGWAGVGTSMEVSPGCHGILLSVFLCAPKGLCPPGPRPTAVLWLRWAIGCCTLQLWADIKEAQGNGWDSEVPKKCPNLNHVSVKQCVLWLRRPKGLWVHWRAWPSWQQPACHELKMFPSITGNITGGGTSREQICV